MDETYEATYSPVLIGLVVGFVFVGSTLFVSNLLAPKIYHQFKGTPYECGMIPIGENWMQMNLRFYLYAILFLIFEIEAVFLFPWAVVFQRLGTFAFYEMMLFLAIIGFGLAYAWRKGVLRWE